MEGMFDLAVLWQAAFHNVTCALGTHLNALQFRQLCADDGCGCKRRTVYLALDSDANGSGQKAAQCLSQRLRAEGIATLHVELPEGHDPNSFFVPVAALPRVSTPVGEGNLRMTFRVTQQLGLQQCAQPLSRDREDRSASGLDQSLPRPAAGAGRGRLHTARLCATIYSISSAGGRARIRLPLFTQQDLTESTFLDYIRYQSDQNPPPAAQNVNRRIGTTERAMRCEFPEAEPLFAPGFQKWCWRQSRLGYGRLRPALTQLRVKMPKRVVVPLSIDEVHRFWHSFRTSRDLAIVGLMVLHGLRCVKS